MSPSNELAGKVALITGGARNIGRELSCMFTAAGANVLVNSRSARPELADTVQRLGADLGAVFVDGERTVTLKGDHIAEEFQAIVENYVQRRYGAAASQSAEVS